MLPQMLNNYLFCNIFEVVYLEEVLDPGFLFLSITWSPALEVDPGTGYGEGKKVPRLILISRTENNTTR